MHESPGRAPLARARPVAGSRATPGEAENAPWGDRPGEADARARLQRGGAGAERRRRDWAPASHKSVKY